MSLGADGAAGFIEVHDRGLQESVVDGVLGGFELAVAGLVDIDQGTAAQAMVEQILEQLAGALERQQLVGAQIGGDGLEAGAVLDRPGPCGTDDSYSCR